MLFLLHSLLDEPTAPNEPAALSFLLVGSLSLSLQLSLCISMASPTQITILLFISLLGFFSTGANGRPGMHFHPCRTFFISYSLSLSSPQNTEKPTNPAQQIPESSSRFFAIYRSIRFPDPKPVISVQEFLVEKPQFVNRNSLLHRSANPFRENRPRDFGVSSLRERTKDILSVVIGLLFGVGCGALTSATMYLAWSLITNRYELATSDDDEVGPNDLGYVKIPATPAKEGYEGN